MQEPTKSWTPKRRSRKLNLAHCAAEEKCFDALISVVDSDGLLTRYPLRESSVLNRVVVGLEIKDRATYQSVVLKLLQDDSAAVSDLRCLLGELYARVTTA